MRRFFSLFAAVCMLAILGVAAARAQTPGANLTISLKDPTFRLEMGADLHKIEDVLGVELLDFAIWGGAGSTIGDDGKPVGSFAALWEFPGAAKGLSVRLGPEYRGIRGERPRFDFKVQFAASAGTSAAFSVGERGRFGLLYSRRF